MKINALLATGKPTLSFEIFPPKRMEPTLFGDDEQKQALEKTERMVAQLAKENPAFISVTCGAAGGSTRGNTLAIAKYVKDCGIPAIAHFTCISSSRERIAEELKAMRASGIENLLCLRGDYPAGMSDAEKIALQARSSFKHAVDLIRALRPSNLCLGGACYPECHPESKNLAEDIAHLKEKVDAGLDFLTTQMFFDNNVLFRYLARLRKEGITIPVIAGVMPVTNGKQIDRICRLSGTYLPPRFRTIVDRFGNNPAAMTDAGVAYATEQIVDLFASGVANVHVYTMNKPEVATRIIRNLDSILRG